MLMCVCVHVYIYIYIYIYMSFLSGSSEGISSTVGAASRES